MVNYERFAEEFEAERAQNREHNAKKRVRAATAAVERARQSARAEQQDELNALEDGQILVLGNFDAI
jgi:hypothetical protein